MNGGPHQQYDLQNSTSRALGNIFYRVGERLNYPKVKYQPLVE